MADTPQPPPRRPASTKWLLTGILLGLAWGLFFGESGDWVKWIGDAFVGLLQMAVLPYVSLSLICNVARLSSRDGARVARVSLTVLTLLWMIGLVTLVVMSLAFPSWKGGSFFSTTLVEAPSSPNWMELFIPSNPFYSLSQNLVPGVVLFSIGLGVALVNVPDKEVLLDRLEILVEGFGRLNGMIVRMSPLGMFGIVGHAAGTLSVGQFQLLQGYVLVYGGAALLLTLWILPSLIACCTDIPHREVLRTCRDLLITAFVIGNTFAVLPLIVDAVKRLMHYRDTDRALHAPEYAVQLAYPFPDLGRIILMVFVPFAAWFYGRTIEWGAYPQLIGVGFLGAFAKPVVTVPLLLDLAEIPGDIFNLFLAVGVLTARFGDMLKAMHLVTFSVLVTAILGGTAHLRWPRLLVRAAAGTAVLLLLSLSLRATLARTFTDEFSRDKLLAERELLGAPVESVVIRQPSPNPVALQPGENPLDRILRRKTVRIGVSENNLPFTYLNAQGDLVGLDIDMAHQLARELEVRIEFVVFQNEPGKLLREDNIDIAMSGLAGTIRRAREFPEVDPYLNVNVAVVVPDHHRHRWRTLSRAARSNRRWRVAVMPDRLGAKMADMESALGTGWGEVVKSGLSEQMEFVELKAVGDYFKYYPQLADVLVTSAEAGSAWTLRYPEFAVVRPEELQVQIPLYYLVADGTQFQDFINNWLRLKKRDRTIEQLYDYWILGRDLRPKKPRWCVLRDVLGWVE